jgi:hypothetical protein
VFTKTKPLKNDSTLLKLGRSLLRPQRLLIFMLALSLSIPAPAANMNQCAELFMTEAPEVIKLEKAEALIRQVNETAHELGAELFYLDQMSPSESRLLKKVAKSMSPSEPAAYAPAEIIKTLNIIYRARFTGLEARLRNAKAEMFSDQILRRRIESDLITLGLTQKLLDSGALKSPSTLVKWRDHLRNKGFIRLFGNILANGITYQVLPAGSFAYSLWLPRLPITSWKAMPKELAEKAFENGIDSIWPDVVKQYGSVLKAEKAWRWTRMVYNTVVLTAFLQFASVNYPWLMFSYRSTLMSEQTMNQAAQTISLDSRVEVQLEGWKEGFKILKQRDPTEQEVTAQRLWMISTLAPQAKAP